MSERGLAEEAGRLLPLAFARDVSIVAAPEGEDRQDVRLVVVIMAQPAPRLIVRARQLRERRGAKLWMAREEADDLQSVFITDDAETAPPRIAVTIRLDQIPPQTHLRFERRPHRVLYVLASGRIGRVPHKARILVRVTIKAARRRRIVGVEAAIHKGPCRARDDAIE